MHGNKYDKHNCLSRLTSVCKCTGAPQQQGSAEFGKWELGDSGTKIMSSPSERKAGN